MATNLDNLLILVGFMARPQQSFPSLFWGVVIAAIVVSMLCGIAAQIGGAVSPRWIGLLGLFPIGLGLREIYQWWTRGAVLSPLENSDATPLRSPAIASVMLASSADSIAALIPIFAETRRELIVWGATSILAVAILGALLVRRIAHNASIGPWVQRVAPVIVPFVLIAVGVYVLLDTPSDVFSPVARRLTRSP